MDVVFFICRKKLASFDVKSLFTNVPVEGALEAIAKAVNNIDERSLPLPKAQYMELVTLCMQFNTFTFGDTEYVQSVSRPVTAVKAGCARAVLRHARPSGAESRVGAPLLACETGDFLVFSRLSQPCWLNKL